MYRVIALNFKVHKFNNYSEALNFKQEHGGRIYIKTYGN